MKNWAPRDARAPYQRGDSERDQESTQVRDSRGEQIERHAPRRPSFHGDDRYLRLTSAIRPATG